MTPAALVAELQARGVTLRPDGETLRVRPVSKVAPEELEALRRHKAEVLRLLTAPRRSDPAVPDDSARRAATFKAQLAAWVGSGRCSVPLLVLPDAPTPREGRCVSCGATLGDAAAWRCPVCVAAVRLALEGRP